MPGSPSTSRASKHSVFLFSFLAQSSYNDNMMCVVPDHSWTLSFNLFISKHASSTARQTPCQVLGLQRWAPSRAWVQAPEQRCSQWGVGATADCSRDCEVLRHGISAGGGRKGLRWPGCEHEGGTGVCRVDLTDMNTYQHSQPYKVGVTILTATLSRRLVSSFYSEETGSLKRLNDLPPEVTN